MKQMSTASFWTLPRVIALILAVGGSLWGLFLLALFGPRAVIFPPAAIGYLITAAYWFRTVKVPSMTARRLIWGASLLVQGGWLCLGIADLHSPGSNWPQLWWLFATVCSIVALVSDWEADFPTTPDL